MVRVFVVLALIALPSWAGAQVKAPDQAPLPLWAAQTSPTQITLGWGAAVTLQVPAAKQVPGAAAGPGSALRIYKIRDGRYRLRTTLGANATTAIMPIEPGDAGAAVQYGIEVVPVSKTGPATAPTILPFNSVTPRESAPASVTAGPTSPASVTAAQSGPGEIRVTWDEVPGATAYQIGRSLQPAGFQTVCQLCPATNAIIDRSVNGATGAKVAYRITALTADGAGRPVTSNILTVSPKGDLETAGGVPPKAVTPLLPTSLWAAQTAPTEVTLVWRAPATATPSKDGGSQVAEYRIYQDMAGGRRNLVSTLSGNATRAVVRMQGDGAQQFLIAAVAVGTAKDTSREAISFNPVAPASAGATKPAAPASVTASQSGAGQITLTWSPVPGATGYLIARSKSPSGFQRLCDLCPATTTYTDTDAREAARYVYEVSAHSAAGPGARKTSNVLDLRSAASGPKDTPPRIVPKSPTAP